MMGSNYKPDAEETISTTRAGESLRYVRERGEFDYFGDHGRPDTMPQRPRPHTSGVREPVGEHGVSPLYQELMKQRNAAQTIPEVNDTPVLARIHLHRSGSLVERAQLLAIEYFDDVINPLTNEQEANGEVAQIIRKAAVETTSECGRLSDRNLRMHVAKNARKFTQKLDEAGVDSSHPLRLAAQTAYSNFGNFLQQHLSSSPQR